jgi:hypothetical protein
MLILASFASQVPAGVGAIAASMAIGGFLLQGRPAIRRAGEDELRQWTTVGGLIGLGFGLIVAILCVTFT